MRPKINILFLHSQDNFGADSAIHGHLMRYLDRERFSVHLACSKGDGSRSPAALAKFQDIPELRIRPTQFAPGFRHRARAERLDQLRMASAFPMDFFALRRYVKDEDIHVIHGTDRPRDAVYAVTLGKVAGAKSVVHVHVAWAVNYNRPARWGVRNADAVFAISRFVKATVLASGTRRERIHTILNSVDPAGWDPRVDGSCVRREFAIPDHAPLLVSVSRLFGQKGQRELLRAVALVRRSVPDVRLLVVGADALEVHGSSFTAELKTLACELGIADRVVFAGERSDIPRIMAACDVFTLASGEEPFGLVFLEAMAMQKPVIALNDGGTPEVVEHGRSGLLSTPQDVDAMAANISTLLGDRDLRDRMGSYGRTRVLDYFNAQRMARDAGAAYEAIVSQ